jgi:hypothetical protein
MESQGGRQKAWVPSSSDILVSDLDKALPSLPFLPPRLKQEFGPRGVSPQRAW